MTQLTSENDKIDLWKWQLDLFDNPTSKNDTIDLWKWQNWPLKTDNLTSETTSPLKMTQSTLENANLNFIKAKKANRMSEEEVEKAMAMLEELGGLCKASDQAQFVWLPGPDAKEEVNPFLPERGGQFFCPQINYLNEMFYRCFIFQSVALVFLYVEQDVNLAWQLCSGLENVKNSIEKCKNLGKNCFAVRNEWDFWTI